MWIIIPDSENLARHISRTKFSINAEKPTHLGQIIPVYRSIQGVPVIHTHTGTFEKLVCLWNHCLKKIQFQTNTWWTWFLCAGWVYAPRQMKRRPYDTSVWTSNSCEVITTMGAGKIHQDIKPAFVSGQQRILPKPDANISSSPLAKLGPMRVPLQYTLIQPIVNAATGGENAQNCLRVIAAPRGRPPTVSMRTTGENTKVQWKRTTAQCNKCAIPYVFFVCVVIPIIHKAQMFSCMFSLEHIFL